MVQVSCAENNNNTDEPLAHVLTPNQCETRRVKSYHSRGRLVDQGDRSCLCHMSFLSIPCYVKVLSGAAWFRAWKMLIGLVADTLIDNIGKSAQEGSSNTTVVL